MLRIRLVVFVTLAALLAPWAVPCLMPGPGTEATMPCCHQADPIGPAARACCTPEGRQPAVPTVQAAAVHAAAVPIQLPATLAAVAQPLPAMTPPQTSARPRSASAVLLI